MSNQFLIHEHERLDGIEQEDAKYADLALIKWDKPLDNYPWGYYASYKIGAEWINDSSTILVTTKRTMENIDFLKMYMTCFNSELAITRFSEIYDIKTDQPSIEAPVALTNVISPLIVVHFLNVVSHIKTLKKGYVHRSENLKKKKGRLGLLKNERLNISTKRFDRLFCEYDEYSFDIPENRIIKKALLASKVFINKLGSKDNLYSELRHLLAKDLSLFISVSSDIQLKEIGIVKRQKLYFEYSEAIRLAKLVLLQYDYSIKNSSPQKNMIVPFVLDMSLLYELYVYGLLQKAYPGHIDYQFSAMTGVPDFLYRSENFKAILDTKYIPKYDSQPLDTYVIRQLSADSRDIGILKRLGYDDVRETSLIPCITCVIIYPTEEKGAINPFEKDSLLNLCSLKNGIKGLVHFYKIEVSLPLIVSN